MKTWFFGAVVLILFISLFGAQNSAYSQEYPEYGVKAEIVADNLRVPWSIDFDPDQRIFFTERGGQVRLIDDSGLHPLPLIDLEVGSQEGGLLGIALHPNFENNHHVYLYYTYSDFLFASYNKIVRFTMVENELKNPEIILDKIPGAPVHDGGRIRFGPDGKLYATTGDALNGALSQDINSLAGKILRINPDGSIPKDNPFENSYVYSFGHRNPQGLDWDPISGKLVATEHGPSGFEAGRVAHDEVNVIYPGKNYGWPQVIGDEHKPDYEAPLVHSGMNTWAPSGASFFISNKIPEWENNFFVAALRGTHLRMIQADLSNNDKLISSEPLFQNEFGRIRDVVTGPDGFMYLLTSNQDGRGTPIKNDDRIIRIVPLVENKMEDKFPIVPNWIKNNAKWWADGLIGDSDFVLGIEFLIKEGILKIPESSFESDSSESDKIPDWIKNNAKWWAENKISEREFLEGIQFLIKIGLIKI